MSIPDISNAEAYLQYLNNKVDLAINGTNTVWISSNTYLVFFMVAGFAFLEAGSSRHKNLTSTLVKNIMDRTIATLAWWLIGFAFAFGESKSGVIGTSFFAGVGLETYEDYTNWMFQWAFSGTSATIVSGCVLERIHMWGYAFFSTFMSVWIYPLIVHWVWSPKGWLKDMGLHDFAGSGVVHMVGGVAGCAATIFIGARIGRFSNKSDKKDQEVNHSHTNNEFKSAYPPFVCLGTLFLWFCWYGFNCGSTITVVGKDVSILVGKIGMNTSIAGSASGLTCFIFTYFLNKGTDSEYSIGALCNGILAGLVGVTASCDTVESWGAMFIGIISGFIYLGYNKLLRILKIDDPIDAIAVHMGAGSWGLVAFGWFDPATGVLYGNGGHQFGIQLLGVVVILGWTATCTFLFFFLIKFLKFHRITPEQERAGIDFKCGGLIHQYDQISLNYYARIFMDSLNTHDYVGEKYSKINLDTKDKESEKKDIELQVKIE
jgi:ammonium transporter, Amt family